MFTRYIQVSFGIMIISNIALWRTYTQQIEKPHNAKNLSLVSDIELLTISEELLNKSSHELFSYVRINYQGHTDYNFTDNAPGRLLNVSFNDSLPLTTTCLIKLFDNYESDTRQPEVVTKEEEIEENEFIGSLIETNVMLNVMHFLSSKGFFEKDVQVYKNTLKVIWFHLYSRSKGINGSSGFEHVFLGESKPHRGVIGIHNWIYFYFGELSNKINYLGYTKNKEIDGKTVLMDPFFTYMGKHKMSTMFIGTSPELEIALYTLCFFSRPNRRCRVSCAEFKFDIQTYIIRNNNTKCIATAFPILGKI